MTVSPLFRLLIPLPAVLVLGIWIGKNLPVGGTVAGHHFPASADSGTGTAAGETMTGNSAAAGNFPAAVPKLSGLSPAETRRILRELKTPAARQDAIRQCLAAMPLEQWKGWVDSLFANDNRDDGKGDLAAMAERYDLLNGLFGAVAAVDPVGFMAIQNSEGERNNDGESVTRVFVMQKWAEQDPAAARAFLTARLTSGKSAPGLEDSAEFMARAMTRNGQTGVLEWAATLPAKERAAAASAALGEMAASDPRAAAEKLVELKDIPELNSRNLGLNAGNLAEVIASSLAKSSPAEALAWAAAQTGAMRQKGLNGALKDWAGRDFEAALGAVSSLPPDSKTAGLSVLLGKTQPERMPEMARLVENQPDGPDRAEASSRVMSVWTQHHPEQASEWMSRQPAGEIRDSAISAFVRWADVRDPEAGLLWAGSMSDSGKRMEAIQHIIQQLGPKAPVAVQPWLDSNPALTEAERAQILQKMNQPR
ncbi:MAG: hypothetical protein V4726_03320 [Verrucomicrobiota bacterium]